ncbi:hypothetical protein M622_18580 [Thauera terpenica 58Eu]|uniref:Uncharacterized protein n=1 Tax=Thauera terpenica 58Eu TaxID=1348657 RepID=T0AUS8_9RHOO|nr:hypothetical protein [Thauera terpenica]EPZ14398.1 hypothetical protein M622_18580 [Thauera terpenica 58Eu]
MDDDKKPEASTPLLFGQRTGVPFNFKGHDGDVRHHTVVIGPTGSGKSLVHSELLDAATKGQNDGSTS